MSDSNHAKRKPGSRQPTFRIAIADDDRTAKLTRRGCPHGPAPREEELREAALSAGVKIPLPKGISEKVSKLWDKLRGGGASLVIARALAPVPPTPGTWELRDNPPLPVRRGEPLARWLEGEAGRDGVSIRRKRIRAPELKTGVRPCSARIRVMEGSAAAVARLFGVPTLEKGFLDLVPLIALSPDRLEATATIPPMLACKAEVTGKMIITAVRACGVVHGVDEEGITAAVKVARASQKPVAAVPIASGTKPTAGEVSRYDFFAAEDAALTPGSIIASRKVRATGRDGQDVTGRRIRFDSAERPELRAGVGVELDEECGELVATRYGQLRFLGEEIALRPLIKISADRLSAAMEAFATVAVIRRNDRGAIESDEIETSEEILIQALLHDGISEARILPEEVGALARDCRELGPDAERGARRLVARGIPARKGEDATIDFEFMIDGDDPIRTFGDPGAHLGDRWIDVGQILATKTAREEGDDGVGVDGEAIEAESGRDLMIEAGEGVEVDRSGLVFVSHGPETTLPALCGSTLTCESMVGVSEDLLLAHFPRDGARKGLTIPDRAGIVAALRRAGVEHGIVDAEVDSLAEKAGKTWTPGTPRIELAVGTHPAHGEPARFVCHIDTQNKFVGAEGDERVDFREMIHSRAVEEGHHLASRVPPTKGAAPGKSVLGTELACRDGFDRTPRPGRGVRLSEDGREYYATREGVYNQRKNSIEVLENYVVDGDVDFSVGHVDTKCMVTVEGTVAAGFDVRADGPVFVGRSVEDAVIRTTASVYVGEGIYFASRAEVYAGEEVDVAVVDRALIVAEGDVMVRREAINADIRTLGTLRFGRVKSRAVGGALRAAKRIEAETIGSELGTTTLVEVGATVGLSDDAPPEPPETGWANLIPRNGGYGATVRVRGKVHPGTIIRILAWSRELHETMAGVEFYLDPDWTIRTRNL
ncbi:MAG: hypothetical protein CME06_09820 [Gemmatimonadetes bacterium]|nr:hypothetical protein [Gemmatimonadota bacterium]